MTEAMEGRGAGVAVWIDEADAGLVDHAAVRAAIATGAISGIGPSLDPGARRAVADEPEMAVIAGGHRRLSEAHWVAHASRAAHRFARLLTPSHASSGGAEGLVQFPLPPSATASAAGLIAVGVRVRDLTAAANVAIGLPYTTPGLLGLRGLVARGISVGIGPIFAPAEFRRAAELYRQGLELRLGAGEDITGVACVTWTPVGAIDEHANHYVPAERRELRDALGPAVAQLIYAEVFVTYFAPAWKRIRDAGAQPVRSGFCALDEAGAVAGPLALPGSVLAAGAARALTLARDLTAPAEADETEAHWVLDQIHQLGMSFRAAREELRREALRQERERWRERLRPATDELSGCPT